MEKKLKLYIWEGVLTDYTDGIAFAMAENKKQALLLVKEEKQGFCNLAYDQIVERKIKPIVFTKPHAWAISGGG